jgi:large subunit ribosomal protein L24
MRESFRSMSAAPPPPDRSSVRCSPELAYSPAKLSLEQLKIGQLESVTLDGAGNFDRVNATGWFALNSSAASLGQLTSLIVPFSPALAARLNAMGGSPGPARLKLSLDLTGNAGQSDSVQARATADLDSALLKGVTTITARPAVAALQGIDVSALRSSDIGIESKLSSELGRALLVLLGLDRVVAAGDGPAQFEGSATGAWGGPLRLKAKISGTGLKPKRKAPPNHGPRRPRPSLVESQPRRFRAAARSQAGGYAGAEHRPVFARATHRQQADLSTTSTAASAVRACAAAWR